MKTIKLAALLLASLAPLIALAAHADECVETCIREANTDHDKAICDATTDTKLTYCNDYCSDHTEGSQA